MSLKSEQLAKEASGAATTPTQAHPAATTTHTADNHPKVNTSALAAQHVKSEYSLHDARPFEESGSADESNEEEEVSTGAKRKEEDLSLSQPSGALPPRKRAKTKDEKEQRRIERIMRNRQAAHASREKKRRHVEELERKCAELTSSKQELQEQLEAAQRSQIQTHVQYQALRVRMEQYEAAIQLARTTGDASGLENVDISPLHDTPLFDRNTMTVSPQTTIKVEPIDGLSDNGDLSFDDQNSGYEQVTDLPPLSYSESNSPQAIDESEFEKLDLSLLTFAPDVQYLDSFSKTHHPAEMVQLVPAGRNARLHPARSPDLATLEHTSVPRRPAASIDELLRDADVRALGGPDAAEPSTANTLGVAGDFTLFADINDDILAQ